MSRCFWNIYGWIFIQPLRWFTSNIARASCGIRWLPEKNIYHGGYNWPNPHWRLLYKTVWPMFKWLNWNALHKFKKLPWLANVLHKIGKTFAFSFYGMECFHCASDDGCPVELSCDETGKYFKMTRSGVSSTDLGTDYWFEGITTCPKCGYQQEYGDSSL